MPNSFGSAATLKVGDKSFGIHRLDAAQKALPGIGRLPFSLKILVENLLRTENGQSVKAEDIEAMAGGEVVAPDEAIHGRRNERHRVSHHSGLNVQRCRRRAHAGVRGHRLEHRACG